MTLIAINNRPNSKNLPLVGIHDAGGTVLKLVAYAPHLKRSLYGFQAQGVDGQAYPLSSVEAIANDVAIATQSLLPYALLGHCFGALPAYELARRRNLPLILIDPVIPLEEPSATEIVATRLAQRKPPPVWSPFDKIMIGCWDACNAYRPARPPYRPSALIIWSQELLDKMAKARQELRAKAWDNFVVAQTLSYKCSHKELIQKPISVKVCKEIEDYLKDADSPRDSKGPTRNSVSP